MSEQQEREIKMDLRLSNGWSTNKRRIKHRQKSKFKFEIWINKYDLNIQNKSFKT